jgi:hypothetical protein
MKKEDIMVIRKNETMIDNVLRTWLFGVMNRTWHYWMGAKFLLNVMRRRKLELESILCTTIKAMIV